MSDDLAARVPAAVTTAAAAHGLGALVSVAHEPSNTTGSRARRPSYDDAFHGVVSFAVGAGLFALGVLASGSPGARTVAIVGGALAMFFGRSLLRESRRERLWDVYHFDQGLVRWHRRRNLALADRWSDFTEVHDRVHVAKRFAVTTSADYRATLTRPDRRKVVLSASAPTRRQLDHESVKLRALVAAARIAFVPHRAFREVDHFGWGAELIEAFRTYAADYDGLPPESAAKDNWVPFPEPYNRIIFAADGEDLAEGLVEPWLASMAPALEHYGLPLDVETVEHPHRFDAEGSQSDYVVRINDVQCCVWRGAEWDDTSWDPWAAATVRPLEVVNLLLSAAGASPVRAHVVNAGDNDGLVVLVDPALLTRMRERGWEPEDVPVVVLG